MKETHDTAKEFAQAKSLCRDLFQKKLDDYGTSWRVMRPASLTDQIYIKARRIRTIEDGATAKVNEGILPEFIGIVNYAVIALIQLDLPGDGLISNQEALRLYDEKLTASSSLMCDKNHDYDEAWRRMRVSSFTDIILQKLLRTKQIEDHDGITKVSEGLDANYMDMVNYALFAIIKLTAADE